MKFLLDHGADKNDKDDAGKTALDYAEQFGRVNLFCNKNFTHEINLWNIFVFSGETKVMKLLGSNNASATIAAFQVQTIIFVAIILGNLRLMTNKFQMNGKKNNKNFSFH